MKIDKILFIITGTTQGLGFDIFNQLYQKILLPLIEVHLNIKIISILTLVI